MEAIIFGGNRIKRVNNPTEIKVKQKMIGKGYQDVYFL